MHTVKPYIRLVIVALVIATPALARAQDVAAADPVVNAAAPEPPALEAAVSLSRDAEAAGVEAARDLQAAGDQPSARPVAVEYSEGYALRRKVHVYASVATLPLFGAQWILGEKLYDGGASDGMRSAHSAVAVGLGTLFGVNSVTGVWNMWEARKDPHGRRRRLIHGLTMLAADGGFVATAALAPGDDNERGGGDGGNRSLHRTVALTSMGVAAGSYLYMLFTR